MPLRPYCEDLPLFQGEGVKNQLIGIDGGLAPQFQRQEFPQLASVGEGEFQLAHEEQSGRDGKDYPAFRRCSSGKSLQKPGERVFVAERMAGSLDKAELAPFFKERGKY